MKARRIRDDLVDQRSLAPKIADFRPGESTRATVWATPDGYLSVMRSIRGSEYYGHEIYRNNAGQLFLRLRDGEKLKPLWNSKWDDRLSRWLRVTERLHVLVDQSE